MEVTSALQSEQHVKKELAKKLGQLQENLGELKETVSNSSRMAGQVCSSSCKGELATDQTLMERWKLVLVTITLGASRVICCLMRGTSMWGQMVAACLVGGFGAALMVWIMPHESSSFLAEVI